MSHTSTCQHDAPGHAHAAEVGAGWQRTPVEPASAGRPAGEPRVARRRRRALDVVALPEVRWAAAAAVLLPVAVAAAALGAPGWLSGALYAGCYASGGWGPAAAGVQALRERRLDVDLLMVVAALGAAAIGQPFDGGLLIVIFATSGALEALATKRTRDSVRNLLDLAPPQATRISPDGAEDVVDAASLAVGDLVLVRPGERVGADGVVVEGASELDQSSITGEPLPVLGAPGDEVFAGTLNGEGSLVVRVNRGAEDWVVARIVTLVAEATATKARAQLFIEAVEQRYSIGVVVATLALFFVPLALGADVRTTLLRAMTFMIVASPCAVVLATMPPLLSAIANAGRHGVLVKSAVVMEQLGAATLVAFDKTGTLTEGTPRVSDVVPLGGDATALLALAAAAERPSEHPLARAVTAAADARGLVVPSASEFRSTPGRGVHAVVGGRRVEVGSPTLLGLGVERADDARLVVEQLEGEGRTAIVVLVDGAAVGVMGVADRLRPDAAAAVGSLAELTGRRPVLMTGDNAGAARRLAEEVGITEVRAGLLPQDKVEVVRELEAGGEHVVVVGDGVNDAPALAAAHSGVAMGRAGSDLALETADAVVVRDELGALPAVIDLSRRARRAVVQNLAFAGAAIVVLVVLDLVGKLPLPLGVAGHEGSTVVVGLNGLRLLRPRAWRAGAPRPSPARADEPQPAPPRPGTAGVAGGPGVRDGRW